MAVDDNGPEIVAITWFLCVLSGGFLGLRVYAKLSRHKGLWWDDHILAVSWVLLLAESIVTQIGQYKGFGKHIYDIPRKNLAFILLGTTTVGTISSFAATLSKISFGVTLLRLTEGPARTFVWFAIITLFLVMLPSAILQWIPSVNVVTATNYGIFNAAWCALMDFALALLPWKMLWELQMKTKEKIGVGVAMSLGLLAGVCAIIKGVYVVQLREEDFSFNGKEVTIWTAVETATAIIGASVPVLRVFFKEAVSSLRTSNNATFASKSIRLSRLSACDHNLELGNNTSTINDITTDMKRGTWTRLAPVREGPDIWSGKSVYRDDGEGTEERIRSEEGILQTNTIKIEYNRRSEYSVGRGGMDHR